MTSPTASQLAQHAAQLLHAAAPAGVHPQAREIAAAAARLLGAAAPVLSAFERQRAALAQEQRPGLAGKLRRMFGAHS